MEKITYTCKSCSWSKSIPLDWSMDKPQFCGNGKCDYSAKRASKTKKSFRTNPEMLEVTKPQKKEEVVHIPESKATPKVDSDFKKRSEERKKKRRGSTPEVETSTEETDG